MLMALSKICTQQNGFCDWHLGNCNEPLLQSSSGQSHWPAAKKKHQWLLGEEFQPQKSGAA